MAQLSDLIVTGESRFLNKINGDITGDAGTVNGHTVQSDVLANVMTHNNTYRGEELLSASHFASLSDLHTAVSIGDFSDIYVGDTITVNMGIVTGYEPEAKDVTWVVMGIDTYLGYMVSTTLYSGLTTSHHIVLVPKDCINSTTIVMNSTFSTTGGYAGSEMYTTVIPAYKPVINASLGNYLITYSANISNAVDDTRIPRGSTNWTGASSGAAIMDCTVTLLSEVEVRGYAEISSSSTDIGNFHKHLPGFRLNPSLYHKLVNNGGTGGWWMSAVCCTGKFLGYVLSLDKFMAGNANASGVMGFVPKVLFG